MTPQKTEKLLIDALNKMHRKGMVAPTADEIQAELPAGLDPPVDVAQWTKLMVAFEYWEQVGDGYRVADPYRI